MPPDDVAALSQAAWLPRLKALRLRQVADRKLPDRQYLGDEGAARLAALPFRDLTRLEVRIARFGRQGLAALAAAPWMQGLRALELELEVGSEQERDACAAVVAGAPALSRAAEGGGLTLVCGRP